MKFLISLPLWILLFVSCEDEKPKTKNHVKPHGNVKKANRVEDVDNNLKAFDQAYKIKTEKYADGLKISWFQDIIKENPTLEEGSVYLISYRVTLPDGKIFDGNNRIDMPFIPFMVGYNMQLKGWDKAMKYLRVGDFAKVEIPSDLAYGSTGLNDIVPKDSKIWLYLKIIAKVSPDESEKGIKTWIFEKGSPSDADESENKEVSYHVIASSKNKANLANSYTKHLPYTYSTGQKNVVPGLMKVLKNAKKGQKMFVLLSPQQAYGAKGYGKFIGPNESVFYNITVVNVREL